LQVAWDKEQPQMMIVQGTVVVTIYPKLSNAMRARTAPTIETAMLTGNARSSIPNYSKELASLFGVPSR
jgi:hypothetical protein